MTDITSTSYRLGLYNYLLNLEGGVPRFYIDTSKNGGNLTGGAGIVLFNKDIQKSTGDYLINQLTGDSLATASRIIADYQAVLNTIATEKDPDGTLKYGDLIWGYNSKSAFDTSLFKQALETEFDVAYEAVEVGPNVYAPVINIKGFRDTVTNPDGTTTIVHKQIPDFISTQQQATASMAFIDGENVESRINRAFGSAIDNLSDLQRWAIVSKVYNGSAPLRELAAAYIDSNYDGLIKGFGSGCTNSVGLQDRALQEFADFTGGTVVNDTLDGNGIAVYIRDASGHDIFYRYSNTKHAFVNSTEYLDSSGQYHFEEIVLLTQKIIKKAELGDIADELVPYSSTVVAGGTAVNEAEALANAIARENIITALDTLGNELGGETVSVGVLDGQLLVANENGYAMLNTDGTYRYEYSTPALTKTVTREIDSQTGAYLQHIVSSDGFSGIETLHHETPTPQGVVNETRLFDPNTGETLGRYLTCDNTISEAYVTSDALSSLLDDIRAFSLSEAQYLLNASEIRDLTGTQGIGEAWGGTDWLEFASGAFGDYWDFASDGSYTGSYSLVDGQDIWLGSNNSLLSEGYSGLGILPAFTIGGNSSSLVSYDYTAVGNTTTTGLLDLRWTYDPSWDMVSSTPLATGAQLVDFPNFNDTAVNQYNLAHNNGFTPGSSALVYYNGSSSYGMMYMLPIALDLDGDGIELVNKEDSRAYFDVKGDGFRNKIGWVGADDAFLAIDKNNDGKIDQADELSFALWTANPNDTDLDALNTVFDTNHDGTLDAADAQWSQLRVWQDQNGDGVTDAGELKTLGQAGIVSINLTAAAVDWASGGNHLTGFTTYRKADGTNGWAADVGLGYEADGWQVSVEGSLVRATQSGGLVYGLSSGGALNLNLSQQGLDGAIGGAGADTLTAGTQVGVLLNGGAGNDILTGGSGDDWLSGGAGADVLRGGAGDDTLLIDAEDRPADIDGGEGFDIAVVTGSAGVTLDMFHAKLEAAIGGDGDDRFYTTGTARAVLAGQGGNDILKSGAGHDVLQGGTGDDILYGGYGTDIAVYTGYQKDYELVANANGSLTVRDIDLANGDDGTDTLYGIQTIRFVDGDVNLSPSNTGKGEFRVNTTTANDQFFPSVSALAGGGYVVAWMDDTASATDANIYAQRYGADGNAVGAQFRVNTYTTNQQELPSVTGLSDGGFVVVWRSYGQDGSKRGIYGQRYAEDGTAVGGEFRINTYTPDHQDDPTVISLADGGFLVTWQSNLQDGSGYGVYAQRFSADGSKLGNEFRVNTSTNDNQFNPEATLLTNGDFVLVWSNGPDPATASIYGQRFDATGNRLGGEFKINTTSYGVESTVAALPDGGYVVAWLSKGSGRSWDVYAQRFAGDGSAMGNELLLSTLPTNSSASNRDIYSTEVAPVLTTLSDGSYVVTWTVYYSNGTADIYCRRAVDDSAVGDVIRVNTTTANNQSTPAVTAMPDGGFVVTWTSVGANSNEDVYAQRYDADGRPWTADTTFTGSSEADQINTSSSSAAVTLLGLAGDDILTAGLGNDTLDGGEGNDTLSGGAGNDNYLVGSSNDHVIELSGEGVDSVFSTANYVLDDNVENLTLGGVAAIDGTGNGLDNTLNGNSAANTLDGGAGADTMLGGAGDDVYVVDNPGDVVTEAASAGNDTVWSAITYTLGTNVENLVLTGTNAIDGTGNTLNNVITGNDAANALEGGSGNDTLNGGGGDDMLNGGVGNDTMLGGMGDDIYMVDSTSDVVTENAGEGTDLVKAAVTYTLGANVENLTLTGTSAINGTGNALDNTLVGNSANNTLKGGDGNDLIDGGSGNDTMVGGKGDDTYFVNSSSDVITENANEGTDTVNSSVTLSLASNVENLILTGTSAINGTGNSLNNVLIGNSAANTLDGGAGADTMAAGAGNDTYVVENSGDIVSENVNEGTDLVKSGITYTLSANVENLTLTGSSAINGTGNALNNVLVGNGAANILDGGEGADTMQGGSGNDTYVVDSVGDVVTEGSSAGTDLVLASITYTLGANVENLTLTGVDNINGTGNTLSNVLLGNIANNVLDGGSGADTLRGGAGDDTYIVDNTGDTVTENANEGADLVKASVTYTLAANVENLTLTGTSATNGTGNASDNILIGNSAANKLTGGAGNDLLDGGSGADTMAGGAGDDTYFVDNTGDLVTENAGEGTDWVQSSVTYVLGANVENLTLTGSAAINGTGNALDNILVGNDAANTLSGGGGNDTLDGGAGADTLIGGGGNDTYVVDNASDLVTENTGEGTDWVQSSITYALGANVENLTLTGSAAINGTGNASDNILVGNSAANVLAGGAGNDVYYVGAGDTVSEAANAGIDSVVSDIAWILGADLENLTLTGTASINGTGNSLSNQLVGNSGNNVLDGGSGADTMAGGAGDDTYVVENIQDIVSEATGEGVDTVESSVTYTLSANVENLVLTGYSVINGYGNDLDNVLTGNFMTNTLIGGGGNDWIDGGYGVDTMIGGEGDDTYFVDSYGEVVTENAGEGIDTVNSSISFALGDNLENLLLNGYAAFSGSGNALANYLRGSVASNTLNGGGGNDLLEGGEGYDTLTDTTGTAYMNGGSGGDTLTGGIANELFIGGIGSDTITTGDGADIIVFNRGDGVDNVYGGTGTDNTLSLGGGIRYTDLTLSKSFNDLVLYVGNGDQIVFKNWYSTSANYKSVATLQLILDASADYAPGGGNSLYDNKVEQFDFAAMVSQFDQARAADMFLSNWALTNALTSFHLGGSDTAALGGDLAYWYGKNGSLTGMNVSAAQDVINAANFGAGNQNLRAFSGISGGMATLA